MKPILLLLFSLLIFSCKPDTGKTTEQTANRELIPEPDKNPVLSEAEVIAIKNGFLEWNNVSEIAFTFNVDRNGKTVAQRSWLWQPKTNLVTMITKGDSLTYNRSKIDSTALAADRGFINDKFWLLAPYQLVWDEGTTITVQDTATAPISKQVSKKLTIVYGSEGGYTPGDAYDFYYQDDFIIDEWVFRKSNANTPSMITTFEDYENVKGINIAKSHKGAENNLNIYFTDIRLKK